MIPTSTEQVRSPHLLRRLLAVVFGLALVGGLTVACSSDDSDDNSSGSSTSDDSYYPHTMATRFGDVTIEKKPERILALDAATADRLITVGITPTIVAVTSKDFSSYPWISDKISDTANSDIGSSNNRNYETVAVLKPDLIVGGLPTNKEDFDKLSAIAPTITPNSEDANPNWKTQFTTTAEAVNKKNEANGIIYDIEQKYREVGKKVPNIENKTYNWVGFSSQGSIGIGNGSLLEMFGLKSNQDNSQNGGNDTIPLENIDQLNADFIGVSIGSDVDRENLESEPGFQNLPAVRNGNIYWAYTAEAIALNLPSPMALDWLLEQLTPSIEALGK